MMGSRYTWTGNIHRAVLLSVTLKNLEPYSQLTQISRVLGHPWTDAAASAGAEDAAQRAVVLFFKHLNS